MHPTSNFNIKVECFQNKSYYDYDKNNTFSALSLPPLCFSHNACYAENPKIYTRSITLTETFYSLTTAQCTLCMHASASTNHDYPGFPSWKIVSSGTSNFFRKSE